MQAEQVKGSSGNLTSCDVALVVRLRRGDADAFTDVVTTYSPAMLHVARAFVSTSAAEDVVQEAWVALLTSLDKFEGRAALRTWACGITANLARRRATKESRTVPWTDAFATTTEDGEGPTVDPSRFRPAGDRWSGGWTDVGAPARWEPEQDALDAETRAVLTKALATLPVRQRTVVALRDIHGLTAEEVCTSLGLSAANQRVLLHRGRAQLRQQLEDYRIDRQEPA